jgi:phosphopantothenoylcysteine decarboxylase/phosphopantothenate--cysteine ligase
MGIAIAEELSARGAEVTLILGPTSLKPTDSSIRIVAIGSALEMYNACSSLFPESDITVFAAAVADYKPRHFSETKIKKKDDDLVLELEKTVDIAAALGKQKKPGQIMAGFALETDNEEFNAKAKLVKKNLDLIVLNSMRDAGAGFGHDTNKVTVISNDGNMVSYELKHKKSVAADIVNQIIRLANLKRS